MPPRNTASLRLLASRQSEPYVCPSCFHSAVGRRKPSATVPPHTNNVRRVSTLPGTFRSDLKSSLRGGGVPSVRRQAVRKASNGSLASVTAINAPSTVPPAYRDLHQRLLALQDEAGTYVNLSRLQLAIRSLESSSPVIRVALLGLGGNGAEAARKLARVLLSDALSEEENWERTLLESGKDGRSLLLRYGDSEDVVPQSPLVQTLHVPSPFLKRHNLELLVSTLNTSSSFAGDNSEAEIEEAILVPPLTTPTSTGGRVGFVRHPVHKALVVAEGITGAVDYGRLPRFIDKAELITAALCLPLRSSTGVKSSEETATDSVIDIDLATHALDLFRKNKANGAQFSGEWQTSRVPAVTQWIAGPSVPDSVPMKPAVRRLLDSVLLNSSAAVEKSETEQAKAAITATIPDSKRAGLELQLSQWSADWHSDLQVNLNTALESKSWRRTAWWRLLWRIDDVSVSAADILRLSWLTEAELSLAFVSGRIAESGLATDDELRQATPGEIHEAEGAEGLRYTFSNWQPKAAQIIGAPPPEMSTAELLQTDTLFAKIQRESGLNLSFDAPWPRTIYVARQQMLHTLVPSLHRKAQALVLQTLSTVGGTTALGAWLSVATAGGAIQGAGAIAALGLVWSLRRLQRLWGKERDSFASALKENGRRVLAEVETHLRKLVKDGGRVSVRPEDAKSWRDARAAIDRCREALERIKSTV